MSIRFGTSGWRAIIADDFTFENVAKVTEAICAHLQTHQAGKPLIIGHDSRFMGEQFAQAAAETASKKGFRVLLCGEPAPTPAISFAIRSENAGGALNFTASHNPPEYQGIKFSTPDGAPALPEITTGIERAIADGVTAANISGGSIEAFDPKPGYLNDLAGKVRFDIIANAGGNYAYDPLWGTGRGYLDAALRERQLQVDVIHDWRDVTFGGRSPEPGESHLSELRDAVAESGAKLGLATDGDADRFGVLDTNGNFIEPNRLIALLTDYLAESRGWKLGAARSVATSHLIDRVAAARGIELFETPVGFKYIGDLINRDQIILGGEESAGLSIRGHYPEKDGILACLLAAEAVAARGRSLSEQLDELTSRVGEVFSGRIGVRLSPDVAARLADRLSAMPDEIASRKIKSVNRLDGVKFIFGDDSWMLMRPSGTEPVVRIYAETSEKNDLEVLLEQGREYLLG